MNLKVKEIFYSIQGEGGRSGAPSIFIRLAECNLNCWFCDTDWSTGTDMTLQQIKDAIFPYDAWWIVWTGGEPTLQLTEEVLDFFGGYMHAIETNGTNPVPKGIDYIAVSPKKEVSIATLKKNFPRRGFRFNSSVNEWRYPYGTGENEPPNWQDLPSADYYYVSPLFMGKEKARFTYDATNAAMCASFALKNPVWSISIQVHKLINVR